ncbi:unnamed protein product [Ilex paraguariensis]|uniref:Uncharacterized protein n=1 Tax=Ilex paraguariensis TaxID=185542 RepID=A0ABC8QRW4_9AQUA
MDPKTLNQVDIDYLRLYEQAWDIWQPSTSCSTSDKWIPPTAVSLKIISIMGMWKRVVVGTETLTVKIIASREVVNFARVQGL